MKRVVILARVSSAKQSMKRQIDELNAYANSKGFDVIATIKETVSGTVANSNRTGIEELQRIVESEPVDEILVHELSRLGRDTRSVLDVINYLHSHQISLYVYNFNLSSLNEDKTINPIANIVFGLVGQFAQMEVMSLRDRVTSGVRKSIRENKENKDWSWGRKVGSTESTEKFLAKHKQVVKYLKNGSLSMREVARLTRKSLQTVLKVSQKMKSEMC